MLTLKFNYYPYPSTLEINFNKIKYCCIFNKIGYENVGVGRYTW